MFLSQKRRLLFDVETFLGNGFVSLTLLEKEFEKRTVVEVGLGEGAARKLGTNAYLRWVHENDRQIRSRETYYGDFSLPGVHAWNSNGWVDLWGSVSEHRLPIHPSLYVYE